MGNVTHPFEWVGLNPIGNLAKLLLFAVVNAVDKLRKIKLILLIDDLLFIVAAYPWKCLFSILVVFWIHFYTYDIAWIVFVCKVNEPFSVTAELILPFVLWKYRAKYFFNTIHLSFERFCWRILIGLKSLRKSDPVFAITPDRVFVYLYAYLPLINYFVGYSPVVSKSFTRSG